MRARFPNVIIKHCSGCLSTQRFKSSKKDEKFVYACVKCGRTLNEDNSKSEGDSHADR